MHLGSFDETPEMRKKSNGVEYVFRSKEGNSELSIAYSLDEESGDLLVEQKGSGDRDHLSAIRFGLGPVSCRGDLLIPSFQGIKANATDKFAKFESTRWNSSFRKAGRPRNSNSPRLSSTSRYTDWTMSDRDSWRRMAGSAWRRTNASAASR